MSFKKSSDYEPCSERLYLSTPTMHGEELEYMKDAYLTNWMSTIGSNIDEVERALGSYVGRCGAVALSSGTSALHLAVKLAGVRRDEKVLCSDLTFCASLNPVVYEGGIPVLVDSELETWNMDPLALEKAFQLHPDARVVVLAHLYGVPANLNEIVAICEQNNAVLIEDAAESLGATYRGRQTGSFGKYSVISFNGNKIITGSSGGMLLTDDLKAADKARKLSTQARENAPWYQHEEIGYNYRMSNVIAGVVRGQVPHLDDHIRLKKEIYQRYEEGFRDLPVSMNPFCSDIMSPNYWLSCLLVNEDSMCKQIRSDDDVAYIKESRKSCPTEILETLSAYNIEGRPIWKPMHMQPVFRANPFVTADGNGRACTNAYAEGKRSCVSETIFNRGLCLPSDLKMSRKEQELVIRIVRDCFR